MFGKTQRTTKHEIDSYVKNHIADTLVIDGDYKKVSILYDIYIYKKINRMQDIY